MYGENTIQYNTKVCFEAFPRKDIQLKISRQQRVLSLNKRIDKAIFPFLLHIYINEIEKII